MNIGYCIQENDKMYRERSCTAEFDIYNSLYLSITLYLCWLDPASRLLAISFTVHLAKFREMNFTCHAL